MRTQIINLKIEESKKIKRGISSFTGNYSTFLKYRKQEYISDLDKFQRQQKKLKQLKSAALARRTYATQMENFKSLRSVKNNGGICSRDDGSKTGLANPKKMMKSAKAIEKRSKIMIEREEAKKPWSEKKGKVLLPISSPCHSKVVLSVTDLNVRYKDKTVFSGVDFEVKRGERLAIVGANGSGKTPLVQLLQNAKQKHKVVFHSHYKLFLPRHHWFRR